MTDQTITVAVVKGWLSRMAPGPWSGTLEEVEGGVARDAVVVRAGADPDTEPIATVEVDVEGNDHTTPIARLPELAEAYVQSAAEVVAVDHQLHAAGLDWPLGWRGVRDLATQRDSVMDRAKEAEGEFETQGRAWSATLDDLDAANARLGAVRALVARWTGQITSQEAEALLRELSGVLLSRVLPVDTADDGVSQSADDDQGEGSE